MEASSSKIFIGMISSTVYDLPMYREQAKEACLRVGVFPKMMEFLPAVDADAVNVSLEMVDDADIYIGIFANRYGYRPKGFEKSITEMEYERAVKKEKPRLIFIATEDATDLVDDGNEQDQDKLKLFKSRLGENRVFSNFCNPVDLRAKIIQSLYAYKESHNLTNETSFHHVVDIPNPPEPYIAHTYTLLQTTDLVGRKNELALLTDWLAGQENFNTTSIFSITAIGGMGKSALTWKWFNDIAPLTVPALSGRIWWSFYESDASFDNFVTRTLAYLTDSDVKSIECLEFIERERELLTILDKERYLLVLDGLERILIAYARPDAAVISDSDLDEDMAREDEVQGTRLSRLDSEQIKHFQLRKTADPRAGQFLRKLVKIRASKVLISTRLNAADLQQLNGEPLPGCSVHELQGLTDKDSIALWNAFGATGTQDKLVSLFHRIDNHPLLIQALASEVVFNRTSPGSYDDWLKAHSDFDPFSIPLKQVKSHVLYFALRGLATKALCTLQTIAAFRMPTDFATLEALLVRGKHEKVTTKDEDKENNSFGELLSWERSGSEIEQVTDTHSLVTFENIEQLDIVLTELEERGLLGWDRSANRYDLHPIVRGVAWSRVQDIDRIHIYELLRSHFESLPRYDQQDVNKLDEMTPAIELFNILVELGRSSEAAKLYSLSLATLHRINPPLELELLERLFGRDNNDLKISHNEKSNLLRHLGVAYRSVGRPDLLLKTVGSSFTLLHSAWDRVYPLCDMVSGSYLTGKLFEAEVNAHLALKDAREADPRWFQPVALYHLAMCLVTRNQFPDAMLAINRSQRMFQRRDHVDWAAVSRILGMQLLTLCGYEKDVVNVANSIWQETRKYKARMDRSFVLVPLQRVWATALNYLGQFSEAEEKLEFAIKAAHTSYWFEEEIAAMIELAENARLQNKAQKAMLLLEDAEAMSDRGKYRLFQADIHNCYARLAADKGDIDTMAQHATEAYRQAWCDGPPFSYYWALQEAKAQLQAAKAPLPDDLENFDPTQLSSTPGVEINPNDEWYTDEKQYSQMLISGFEDDQ